MKTKKTFFLLALILLTSYTAISAQGDWARSKRSITADMRFGVNLGDMDMVGSNDYKKTDIGLLFSGYVNFKVKGGFQIQTGLMGLRKGVRKDEYTYTEEESVNLRTITRKKLNVDAVYVQIPLNIGYEYYFTPTFALSVNAGVYVAYGYKGSTTIEGNKSTDSGIPIVIETYDDKYDTFSSEGIKRGDYGLGANVGFVYDIYAMTLGYDHGLANVSNQKGQIIKNKGMHLSLGFRF